MPNPIIHRTIKAHVLSSDCKIQYVGPGTFRIEWFRLTLLDEEGAHRKVTEKDHVFVEYVQEMHAGQTIQLDLGEDGKIIEVWHGPSREHHGIEGCVILGEVEPQPPAR